MDEALKPCPFCGAPAHFFKITDLNSPEFGGEGICCQTDGCAQMGLMFACGESVKEHLSAAWNRRAPVVGGEQK